MGLLLAPVEVSLDARVFSRAQNGKINCKLSLLFILFSNLAEIHIKNIKKLVCIIKKILNLKTQTKFSLINF